MSDEGLMHTEEEEAYVDGTPFRGPASFTSLRQESNNRPTSASTSSNLFPRTSSNPFSPPRRRRNVTSFPVQPFTSRSLATRVVGSATNPAISLSSSSHFYPVNYRPSNLVSEAIVTPATTSTNDHNFETSSFPTELHLLSAASLQSCPPIFEDLTFAITSNFEQEARYEIAKALKQLGAKVRYKYSAECTHLLTPHQYGKDYETAVVESRWTVTLQWVADCVTAKRYIVPCKPAIHFPLRDKDGIPEMRNMVISVTGFLGEERNDVKYLIRACGARYSGALSKKENTHLVCCVPEGEKYQKALEWKIKVVSKRWLFDCIMQWTLLPEPVYADVAVNR